MHRNIVRLSVWLLLALPLLGAIRLAPNVAVAPAIADPATVGVWSNACHSSNITITNPSCGTLKVNTSISVELNITNAPSWNAYDLFLYYDPHVINATGYSSNQTVFTNAFPALESFERGLVHLAVANLGSGVSGTGTMVHIFFKILGNGTSSLALGAGSSNHAGFASSWTSVALGTTRVDVTTSDGYFKNHPTKLGPRASFTITPSAPTAGDLVTFNATATFDPDVSPTSRPGIRYYAWDFGDLSSNSGTNGTDAIVTHAYSKQVSGNFSVRLTVVDLDDSFSAIAIQRLSVGQLQIHDISIGLTVLPQALDPGGKVAVTAVVTDTGTYAENFSLTVSYESPKTVLDQSSGHSIAASGQGRTFTSTYTIDTTGLPPGAYTVSASATIPQDATPSDNSDQRFFNVNNPSNASSYLILVAGVIIAVVAVVAVTTFLRRRRKKEDLGSE